MLHNAQAARSVRSGGGPGVAAPVRRRGFSMLELVIVVVIVAVVAGIAVVRLGSAAERAGQSALIANARRLIGAIDHYTAEHGGVHPDKTRIAAQLTRYTDAAGNVAATKDDTHIYGPYLHKIPHVGFGLNKDNTKIAEADAADVGWLYDETTGRVRPNTEPGELDQVMIQKMRAADIIDAVE